MRLRTSFDFELTINGIMRQISKEIAAELPQWERTLAMSPGQLVDVEQQVLGFSRKIASYLTAAVLSRQAVIEAVEREGEQIIQEQQRRFKNGYPSEFLEVKFLCGLTLEISTPYLERRKQQTPRRNGKRTVRGEEGAGLYPELAVLGILKGASPALSSETARQAVLLPSYEVATVELRRQGVPITQGAIRTILLSVGLAAVGARKEDLQRWKDGQLVPTEELKGRKVAVAFDGGKTRIRVSKKGRRRSSGRRGYHTSWREPRLLVIYVLDKSGRIDRSRPVVLDGTFQKDTDHLMELAAYHLYRLGAQKAEKVVFLGDGAEWIWNRVPTVAEKVGLQEEQWTAVLDFYHAMEHVNAALKAAWGTGTKLLKKERKRAKKLLLAGKVEKLLVYLSRLKKKKTGEEFEAVEGCIKYIQERAKLMDYAKLKSAGFPIGSGAIESAIRRVINLRLKAPGTFWREDTAEVVLYMRAQVLTNNWDAMLDNIRKRSRYTRDKQYKWDPTPMSVKEMANPKVVLMQEVVRKKRKTG